MIIGCIRTKFNCISIKGSIGQMATLLQINPLWTWHGECQWAISSEPINVDAFFFIVSVLFVALALLLVRVDAFWSQLLRDDDLMLCSVELRWSNRRIGTAEHYKASTFFCRFEHLKSIFEQCQKIWGGVPKTRSSMWRFIFMFNVHSTVIALFVPLKSWKHS